MGPLTSKWDEIEAVWKWSDSRGNPYFIEGAVPGPDDTLIPACVKVVNSSLSKQYQASGVSFRDETGQLKKAYFNNINEPSWNPEVIKGVREEIERLKDRGTIHQEWGEPKDLSPHLGA